MTKTKENSSPFSAKSYQEQQDQWLEWRSRQLNYCAVKGFEVENREATSSPLPIKVPFVQAAPISKTRHGELDRINQRHQAARKKAIVWQSSP